MAIAFRSVGATLKADVTVSPATQTVALPPGHVSGDLILMFVLTDGNSNAQNPPGWANLANYTNGTSTTQPYAPHMVIKILYRLDNGSLGSSVPLTFTKATWPVGNPYVLAFTAAYSGCDPTGPVEQQSAFASTTSTATFAPQVTTTTANDWLLTYRCVSSDSPAATFTTSVGTDAERVDDNCFAELAAALYDSNAALATGLQTQRTTTASRTPTYGSMSISIVLKPLVVPATYAMPPEAGVAVTAYPPTVQTQDGGWDLCGPTGLPVYRFAVDWNGDGSNTVPGEALTTNGQFRSGATGWTGLSVASAAPSADFQAVYGLTAMKMTPDGVSSSGSLGIATNTPVGSITPGNTYATYAWVYSPAGWSDMRVLADWYDASNTLLSTMASTAVAVPAGRWTFLALSGVAPASASRARLRVRQGATPSATDVWYAYSAVLVDPNLPGSALIPAPGEDVTLDVVSDISVTYGRDQQRQLNPAAVGSASFTLENTKRKYSPENASSPLFGDLDPARVMTSVVDFNGQTYPLFRGRIDDYTVNVDFADRTVGFTFLDGLNDLSATKISTEVCASMRTGDLIDRVLDEAGWSGGRDIDRGATVVKWWWVDNTDALAAITDLVKSEGPPAVAYVAPDNTFVFRDRHHRIQRQASLTARATFHAGTLGDCDPSTVPSDAYSIARPFVYAHGWRDIINTVAFDVSEREPSGAVQPVWTDQSSRVLQAGQSVDVDITVQDPFIEAVTPVLGTDVVYSGPGTPTVVLSRDSGASAKITLMATGGPVTVTSLQLRARTLAVGQTARVSMADAGSVSQHGERSYPDSVPWAGAEDAAAIAGLILLHYARRLPTVQIRLVSSDPVHFVQVLTRTISDRVHIVNDEMGLDDDFFVERITHTVQRIGAQGRPPVHAVVLGCEKDLPTSDNPFTFDKRGAGFDAGMFDAIQTDGSTSVFVFDDPVQGVFDQALYGT